MNIKVVNETPPLNPNNHHPLHLHMGINRRTLRPGKGRWEIRWSDGGYEWHLFRLNETSYGPSTLSIIYMKLLPSQIDETSLTHLGEEVVSLLKKRDFPTLADQFGYALAFEEHPAMAIENDLKASIDACRGMSAQQKAIKESIIVKYFNPNKSGLFALIECTFHISEDCPLLAELVVSSDGTDKYVTLEQLSPSLLQGL